MAEGTGEKTDRQGAREAYSAALILLYSSSANAVSGNEVSPKRREGAYHGFIAATVDLMLTGLDEYLIAAKAAQDSAQKDRDSAVLDRQEQDKDRNVMNRLTGAIVFFTAMSAIATGVSAYRASVTVQAPVVNISPPPAPIVNIPAVPVTLSPTINVTLPMRASRSAK